MKLFIPRKTWVEGDTRAQADEIANYLAIERAVNGLLTGLMAATFHWPTSAGQLTSGVSDAQTIPGTSLTAVVIDVGTFTNNFTIDVNAGLTVVKACAITAGGLGQKFPLSSPFPVTPNATGITVNAVSPGTGNTGIFVRVEWATS